MPPRRRDPWSQVPAHIRAAVRRQVFARDGGRCRIEGPDCLGIAQEVDHIVPVALGGALLDLDNLRASCRICNGQRGVVTSVLKRLRNQAARAARPSRDW